jgi:glycosyltransferase involved in cell wall biosynthesis
MVPVSEPKPGLTNARMAGFRAASGKFLVFFDDDNQPGADYLLQVNEAFQAFPNVGVFGPGHITVEFMGNPPAWVSFNKPYFQERHFDAPRYACMESWQDFFPPGTGQSMRRSVFENYASMVQSGQLSATDRSGKSLSSAGDVQLVFEAVKMGFAVGVFPGMQTRHLIAETKANARYIRRLLFGMAVSYPEAYAECFPHTRKVLPYHTNWAIFLKIWDLFWKRIVVRKSPKAFLFLLSELLGRVYGSNHARGHNKSSFWFQLIPWMGLR